MPRRPIEVDARVANLKADLAAALKRESTLAGLLNRATAALRAFWVSYRRRYGHEDECLCRGCQDTRQLFADIANRQAWGPADDEAAKNIRLAELEATLLLAEHYFEATIADPSMAASYAEQWQMKAQLGFKPKHFLKMRELQAEIAVLTEWRIKWGQFAPGKKQLLDEMDKAIAARRLE